MSIHLCRCVMVYPLSPNTSIYCIEPVSDRPFCDGCESRHPVEVAMQGVKVSALPLDVPHPRRGVRREVL